MPTLLRTKDKFEAARQDAQLRLARAVRYEKTEDAEVAGRDFAFAKLMITLVDLIEEYPALTDEQVAEATALLGSR